jgi:predicted TIM-barrel fold metal-dependent hydrolase
MNIKWTVVITKEISSEDQQEWAKKILETGASAVLKVTNAAEQSEDVFIVLLHGSIGAYLKSLWLTRNNENMYIKRGWCF